ncbi:MAG: phosphoesterase PA-phosphatase [Anaerolineae bacterium]|nr:phosphoesterase PA-phosphatase [Anaerolineae bacterium]
MELYSSVGVAGSWAERIAPTTITDRFPRVPGGRIAYLISQAGSPPVLSLVALIVVAATTHAWALAGVYALLAIVIPLAYLVWLVRRGQVTDLDVQLREQRKKPMLFTLLCGALAWAALTVSGAPTQMRALAGALWVQMGLVFIITLWWKISVHCSSAATVTTLTGCLAGTLLPLVIALPLIAWSRVRLRRHTPAQTIAGTLLGCAIALLALHVIG